MTALISALSVSTIQAIPAAGFAIAQPAEGSNMGMPADFWPVQEPKLDEINGLIEEVDLSVNQDKTVTARYIPESKTFLVSGKPIDGQAPPPTGSTKV